MVPTPRAQPCPRSCRRGFRPIIITTANGAAAGTETATTPSSGPAARQTSARRQRTLGPSMTASPTVRIRWRGRTSMISMAASAQVRSIEEAGAFTSFQRRAAPPRLPRFVHRAAARTPGDLVGGHRRPRSRPAPTGSDVPHRRRPPRRRRRRRPHLQARRCSTGARTWTRASARRWPGAGLEQFRPRRRRRPRPTRSRLGLQFDAGCIDDATSSRVTSSGCRRHIQRRRSAPRGRRRIEQGPEHVDVDRSSCCTARIVARRIATQPQPSDPLADAGTPPSTRSHAPCSSRGR